MSHTETPQKLRNSIEQLYRVFSDHRPHPAPEGCPCCATEEHKIQLASKPLRELTDDDLYEFYSSALLTWGTVEDFKWFLPRLLELAATFEIVMIDWEILLGKLRLGEWKTWKNSEKEAIDDFLAASWQSCLESGAGSFAVDSLLCGLGRAVDDLAPYLLIWSDCRLKTGYQRLDEFIDENFHTLVKGKGLSNGFWNDAEPQMTQVMEWLTNKRTLKNLEQIYLDQPDAPFSEALSNAANKLSHLQATLRSLDR